MLFDLQDPWIDFKPASCKSIRSVFKDSAMTQETEIKTSLGFSYDTY